MRLLTSLFVIFLLKVAQGRPGYHHGTPEIQLQGSPDLESYGKISYPKFDIIDLGEYSKGELPPKVIVSEKHITIKVPQPYPVKVPHKVPYPVHIEKPYPVIHTKIVKVPQPIPYPIEKKVPVPIEVPKPYPVPVSEHHGGGSDGGYGGGDVANDHGAQSFGNSYGGDAGGHQQLAESYGVPGHQPGVPVGEQDYNSGYQQQSSYEASFSEQSYGAGKGQHEADQSAKYPAVAQPQGWIPASGQQEEQQNSGESKE